ncbi:MAG: carbohydrate kinase [Lentisphaeria bacterium]|nr:carbohydrate kinase [Lentisphaeria bacterium]
MNRSGKVTIAGIGEVLWDCFPDHEAFGGAPANFACHCCSLGAEAHVISAVGDDDRGAQAKAFLTRHGVKISALAKTTYETGVVQVVLDGKGKPEYDIKANAAWDHIPWSEDLARLAGRLDAVCFGSLGQRDPASRDTIRRVLAATGPACLKVFDINLRQAFHNDDIILTSLELADVLKLNDEELPVVAALIGADGDKRSIMTAVMERFNLKLAVLTLGPEGALMMTPDESSFIVPPDDPVINTVGAGDSFTAATIMGFLKGRSLDHINRHANEVATFVCTRDGAVPELPAALIQTL